MQSLVSASESPDNIPVTDGETPDRTSVILDRAKLGIPRTPVLSCNGEPQGREGLHQSSPSPSTRCGRSTAGSSPVYSRRSREATGLEFESAQGLPEETSQQLKDICVDMGALDSRAVMCASAWQATHLAELGEGPQRVDSRETEQSVSSSRDCLAQTRTGGGPVEGRQVARLHSPCSGSPCLESRREQPRSFEECKLPSTLAIKEFFVTPVCVPPTSMPKCGTFTCNRLRPPSSRPCEEEVSHLVWEQWGDLIGCRSRYTSAFNVTRLTASHVLNAGAYEQDEEGTAGGIERFEKVLDPPSTKVTCRREAAHRARSFPSRDSENVKSRSPETAGNLLARGTTSGFIPAGTPFFQAVKVSSVGSMGRSASLPASMPSHALMPEKHLGRLCPSGMSQVEEDRSWPAAARELAGTFPRTTVCQSSHTSRRRSSGLELHRLADAAQKSHRCLRVCVSCKSEIPHTQDSPWPDEQGLCRTCRTMEEVARWKELTDWRSHLEGVQFLSLQKHYKYELPDQPDSAAFSLHNKIEKRLFFAVTHTSEPSAAHLPMGWHMSLYVPDPETERDLLNVVDPQSREAVTVIRADRPSGCSLLSYVTRPPIIVRELIHGRGGCQVRHDEELVSSPRLHSR
ncbi:hypothetical protein CSUI_009075 [Cystoisospora suis]|uniref:Uncharacterized protein n=1 Tax=Cystoisospora suis TaxID=483139 RepID=A0A2C6JJJ5_9APIC|nr:hypothetical protein CSUI_009075 [Cystoisospora suis]